MEVFIRFNSFFNLILYLIVTSDFPPGAYSTNQLSLAYSAANSNSRMLVNWNFAFSAGRTDNTRFYNDKSSVSLLPIKRHDSTVSSINSHKLSSSKIQPASFNDKLGENSLSSSLSSIPITEMETVDSHNRDSGTDINFSPTNNIAPTLFSNVPHSGLAATKRSGRNEISRAQVPFPSSSMRNPKASRISEGSEGNSFPVAFLISESHRDGGNGGTPGERIPTRSSFFNGRLNKNDIVRRAHRSGVSENVSIPMETMADENVSDATTSINNSSNDNNQDISLDIITVSSSPPPSLQASAPMSEDEGTTSSSPVEGSTSTPLETDHVANDDKDSGGGVNITNEYSNATTPEPGTTPLRGNCNETSQCWGEFVECRLGICKCQLGYLPRVDNGDLCGEASAHHVEVPTTDPTMIGVVVGLALMSVTLCIVLRLFAKARFRENRTIFNTPNPRLMNVSLLKGSKTLLRGNSAGQRSRRGSQTSMASDGQSPATTDGNGVSGAGSSSHPHRVKPSRTPSTDTTNLEGTSGSEGRSSKSLSSANRGKYRQDSVASNV